MREFTKNALTKYMYMHRLTVYYIFFTYRYIYACNLLLAPNFLSLPFHDLAPVSSETFLETKNSAASDSPSSGIKGLRNLRIFTLSEAFLPEASSPGTKMNPLASASLLLLALVGGRAEAACMAANNVSLILILFTTSV